MSNVLSARLYVNIPRHDSNNTYNFLCADGATHSLSTLRLVAGLYTKNGIMVVVDIEEIDVWMCMNLIIFINVEK